MIPLSPVTLKLILITLGAMVALTPIQHYEAGKIQNKIQNKLIEKAKEKRKQIDNPNYIPKKLPIIAGYKEGENPLPKGRTAKDNYKEVWKMLKDELGWK